MNLTMINGNGNNDDDVAVHAAGCRDIAKYIKTHHMFTEEHATKESAWSSYNADFLDEEGAAWPLNFKNCCKSLPEGGPYNL